MHQTSARVHHNPENTSFGVGPSIATNSMPTNSNGPSSYPNVSLGSNMNCGTEVNALSEELRVAVEECQVRRCKNLATYSNCNKMTVKRSNNILYSLSFLVGTCY